MLPPTQAERKMEESQKQFPQILVNQNQIRGLKFVTHPQVFNIPIVRSSYYQLKL